MVDAEAQIIVYTVEAFTLLLCHKKKKTHGLAEEKENNDIGKAKLYYPIFAFEVRAHKILSKISKLHQFRTVYIRKSRAWVIAAQTTGSSEAGEEVSIFPLSLSTFKRCIFVSNCSQNSKL